MRGRAVMKVLTKIAVDLEARVFEDEKIWEQIFTESH